MKRAILAILLAMIASSAVLAVDFSAILQQAKPWPGTPVSVAGMQSRTAPANTLTAVKYWTQGWITGTNSRPISVWAVPRNEAGGVRWRIVSVKAYCSNPATGEWLERCQPTTKNINTTTLVTVESESPARRFETTVTLRNEPNPMPGMVGGRETDSGFPIAYGSETSSSTPLIVPFIMVEPEQECQTTTPETPITCDPNGTPPDPPSVGAATGTGTGGQPAAPPSGGNQPPPQATHNTGGATWDPSPSHPKVADPVRK